MKKLSGLYLFIFLFLSCISFAATVTSVASGNWNNNGTWDCGCTPSNTDDVIVASGHTVKLLANGGTTVNNLTVQSSGRINGNGKNLTIDGNSDIDGSIFDLKNLDIDGSGATIDGLGSITFQNSGAKCNINASVSVLSTASLIITNSQFKITGNYTLTNNGTFFINADVNGQNANSTFTNAATGIVYFGGSISTITLNASSSGNTVVYYEAGNQDIYDSNASTYHHLKVTGGSGDSKTLTNNVIINGDLTIQSVTLDASVTNYNINIKGNWYNYGSFNEQSATVTFDGTTDQSITATGGETYYNLITNKSSGTLSLNNNVSVTEELTMTVGNIDALSNILTVGYGTGAGEIGTLSYTAGIVIGWYEKFVNATGSYLFPVGTSTDYRPANITYNGGLTNGSQKIRFVDDDPGGDGLSIDDDLGLGGDIYNRFTEGYWDVEANNSLACTDYDITLTATNFTSVASAPNAPRILTRADENTAFSNAGQLGTHGGGWTSISRTTVTTATQQFCIGGTNICVSPVWVTNPTPAAGDDDVCINEAGTEYSASGVNVTTYVWGVTGGTITNQSAGNITVTWGATGGTGDVEVQLQNACLTTGSRNTTVTINPIEPSAIIGNINVPTGGTKSYSVTAAAGYTYDWGTADGTIDAEVAENATVTWGAINPGAELCVTATHTVCASDAVKCVDVNVYQVIRSVQSGDWTDPSTWECNCNPKDEVLANRNVMIMNSHTVDLDENNLISNHTTINTGGALEINGKNGFEMQGDLTIDGTILSTGTDRDITFSSVGTPTIDGVGTINLVPGATDNKFKITGANTSILSGSNITFIGDLEVATNINLTNNASVIIQGDLMGTSATTSDFINAANSTLKVTKTLFEGASAGDLTSTATGNSVYYNGDAAQNVKSTSYYNLYVEDNTNNSIKTLLDAVDIENDLTIDGANLDVDNVGNFQINIAGDWTNTGGTFTPQNGLVIFDGTTSQIIDNSAGESFYSLKMSKIANTVISLSTGNITIGNELNLVNGIISTGSNIVYVSNNASTSVVNYSGTSFVNGNLRRAITSNTDVYAFPVGNGTATTNYYAVDLVNNSLAGINYITGYVGSITEAANDIDANLDNTKAVQDGTEFDNIEEEAQWDLTPDAAPSGGSYGVRLYTANIAGLSDNQFAPLKRNSASTTYADWDSFEGTTTIPAASANGRTTASGYAERLGYTTFSKFAVASAPVPLPVELVSFTALLDNNIVYLDWETASETNNDYFEIEKSINAVDWEMVDRIEGMGNSPTKTSYSTVDLHPYSGVSNYRLKQVDWNGNYSYSSLQKVKSYLVVEPDIRIFPNPAIDRVKITSDLKVEAIKVFNSVGKQIQSSINSEIPISNFASGVYYIKIYTANGVTQRQFVKQ